MVIQALDFSNGGGASQFGIQAIGVLAYGVWATVTALIGFGILKSTIGLRVSEEVEIKGLDETEHGMVDLKVADSKLGSKKMQNKI